MIDYRFLSVYIGAMVENKHLTNFTEEDFVSLEKLLFYRKAVFFEDQNLTKNQIKELGNKLKFNPSSSVEVEDLNNSINFDYGSGWHSDRDYMAEFPNYTIFQIEQLPDTPLAGATEFMDMVNFYKYGPSEEIKKLLRGLTATHEYIQNENMFIDAAGRSMVQRSYFTAIHPAVLETTFKNNTEISLFLNPCHVTKLNELRPLESRGLLDTLYRQMSNTTEFQYLHRWKPGSLVIWNNRLCLHRALKDFYPEQIRRATRAVIY